MSIEIMSELLSKLRIVLLETSHPGNIGATARAMKNMGLQRLILVKPGHYPDAIATARAAGAGDLLHQATVVETLGEAIADCKLVLGTSARPRTLDWPMLPLRQAVEYMVGQHTSGVGGDEIAILFGTESVGLSNQQLQRCHYRIEIPTNPEYSSLNLAQAVQVVCYELRQSQLNTSLHPMLDAVDSAGKYYADDASVNSFLSRLQALVVELDVLNPAQPDMLVQRLRRLFLRARMEKSEVSILQGIISAMLAEIRGERYRKKDSPT